MDARDIRQEDLLFKLCTGSPTLVANEVIADAVDRLDAQAILNHFYEQRAWYGGLSQMTRQRFEVHGADELMYAKEAIAKLCAFEAVVTPAPV